MKKSKFKSKCFQYSIMATLPRIVERRRKENVRGKKRKKNRYEKWSEVPEKMVSLYDNMLEKSILFY